MKRTTADMELRRVGQFSPDPELQRTIAELEQNVHRALNAHKEQKAERHQATAVAHADVQAEFGQTVLYDPTGGTFTVSLPKVSQSDHGKTIRLRNTAASATAITVRAATGQLVDGASTMSVSGSGARVHLFCDGNGWWAV